MNARNRLLLRQAHRAPRVQIRALDDKEGRFQARVMHYDVVDDYRTIFAPGLFRESLEARLPRVVWAHDWAEPLGRYIDYDDTATHLDLIGEFDNFDDVPRARQAYAQLKSGTIDEFSVGFMPLDGEEIQRDGENFFRFTRARLDEVSLVLAGAVPNTQLLAVRQGGIETVRSPMLTVSKDFAAQTILDLHAGKIDLADALQQVKLNAVLEEEDPDEEEKDTGDEDDNEGAEGGEDSLDDDGSDDSDDSVDDLDGSDSGVGEGTTADGEEAAGVVDAIEELDMSEFEDIESILEDVMS